MENIVRVSHRNHAILNFLGGWGCIIIILTGIIGCTSICNDPTKVWNGLIFGFSLIVVAFLISKLIGVRISQLEKYDDAKVAALVDALKCRRLSHNDLIGFDKEEIERLRWHIYAMNGYNFNVNDGLYFLDKITRKILSVWTSSNVTFDTSNLSYYSRMFGCSVEQLIMALDGYNKFRLAPGEVTVTRTSGITIERLSEVEKDFIREYIEMEYRSHRGRAYIGHFNRDGEDGHEGRFYYEFKNCSWYMPYTSNLDEAYSHMSEIEKYNVDFIKVHEDNIN